MLKKYSFREAFDADIPAMKIIRDNVRDGKGGVCLDGDEVVGFSCGRMKQEAPKLENFGNPTHARNRTET